jgi:hypothetical protein
MTPESQCVLRLWHGAGDGIAVPDLGRLLPGRHWRASATAPEAVVPAATRIAAVMAGSCTHRPPGDAERAVLRDAVRFSVAYGAAEHLSRVRHTGWSAALEQAPALRLQWYAAGAIIAELAPRPRAQTRNRSSARSVASIAGTTVARAR